MLTPSRIIIIIPVLLATICGIVVGFLLYRAEYDLVGAISLAILWGVIPGGLVPCLVLYLLLMTEVRGRSVVVKDGQILAVVPEITLFWKWNRLLKDSIVYSYDEELLTISMMGPQSIVPNKVRGLVYSITVKAWGTPEKCLECAKHLQEIKMGVKDWLKYLLYEFNEAKSQEIAGFYNPCDDRQQSRFQKLAGDFLEPHLANTGLQFQEARFNIPKN